MTVVLFDPDDLTELVDIISGTGPDATPASLDPTDLSLPGCWVKLDTVRRHRLGGGAQQLACTVYVIVPNVAIPSAIGLLAEHAGRVADRLAAARVPAPEWSAVSVAVPGYDQPLPALSAPLTVSTSPTT